MNHNLEALKAAANVPDIVGKWVQLSKQGNGFVGSCPFHTEKTPSFKLDFKDNSWVFKCFGCGKGGDVITFLELIGPMSPKDAIEKLTELVGPNKAWLEGARKTQENFKPLEDVAGKKEKPKTTIGLVQWERVEKALWAEPKALAWLRDVRGLNDEVIKSMHLGYTQKHVYRIKDWNEQFRDKGWIMFPRLEGDGDKTKIVAVKFRSIAEKLFSQINNMDSRALFNVESINPLEPVYVTEGELDACVLEMAGFRAVSCPSAGVDISTESRIKLKLAERIFLAGDNDGGVGTEYMKKLLRELGENTHWLVWPDGKDANDFFRDVCNRGIDRFRLEVTRLSKAAKEAPPEGFLPILERLRASEGTDLGADPNRMHMPPHLADVDRMTYTPRGGVALIYSTYSGTGKSMFKSQILLHEAKRGEIVVDLSPEIRDDEYLALITSQVVGPTVDGGLKRTSRIDRDYYLQAADLLDTPTEKGTEFKYYVGHNVLGQEEDEVIEFLENTIRTLGATRFAIDTFHRLIVGSAGRQTEAEGRMIKRIEELGIKYGTIFILIAQSNAEAEGIDNLKKNEHGVLRGSREIRDIPASIFLVHRNRRPQKDGEDPDDILELETGVFAKKTRYKGPGKPQCRLLLKEEWSLFVPMAVHSSSQPDASIEENFG